MILTTKEIARADNDLTIVVRKQASGGYLVMVVRISTNVPLGHPHEIKIDTKSEIPNATYELGRWLDKMGYDCTWASATRDRVNK